MFIFFIIIIQQNHIANGNECSKPQIYDVAFARLDIHDLSNYEHDKSSNGHRLS